MIAERRHHAARIKAKRRDYYRGWAGRTERNLGVALHTAAQCSCWACGNARKYLGEETMQERKHKQSKWVDA